MAERVVENSTRVIVSGRRRPRLARIVTHLTSSEDRFSFERDWLGVTSPPAHVLMTRSGWAPDEAGVDYCPRCGSSIGMGEFDGRSCGSCRRRRMPWERIIRLGGYDGDVRDWIHDIKFARNDHLARALGREIGKQLLRAGIGAGVIIPVPTPTWRRIRRGIDHTASLARGVCGLGAFQVRRPLRRSHRPVQRAVAPSARQANVSGTFSISPLAVHRALPDQAILLDDVMTTGATLSAACRVLHQAGVRHVTCAVIAVVDHRHRVQEPSASSPSAL